MQWLFLFLWGIAPLYVWRFTLFGLPTNFLMLVGFLVIGLVTFVAWRKDHLAKFSIAWRQLPRPLWWSGSVFGLAVTLSLFIGGVSLEKFGQWLVLYFQPIILGLFAYAYLTTEKDWRPKLVQLLYLLVGLAGWLAIVQYFTLWTLPVAYVGNPVEPKRALAFWSHPNGFGLFVVPILAWLLPDLSQRISAVLKRWNKHDVWAVVCWLFGAMGIILSLSRGAWFGLVATILVSVFFFGTKKSKSVSLIIVAALALTVYLVPSLHTRIIGPFAGEKSASSRLSLWRAGLNGVIDAPIFGKGINGFNENWDNYNPDPTITHHNFPHNILLDFWVDTGLLGALSFLWLCGYLFYLGWRGRQNPYLAGVALFVVAIWVHGMIDNPYFKNDLALVFWLTLAVSLVPEPLTAAVNPVVEESEKQAENESHEAAL